MDPCSSRLARTTTTICEQVEAEVDDDRSDTDGGKVCWGRRIEVLGERVGEQWEEVVGGAGELAVLADEEAQMKRMRCGVEDGVNG